MSTTLPKTELLLTQIRSATSQCVSNLPTWEAAAENVHLVLCHEMTVFVTSP